MPTIDIFNNNAFSMVSLTEAVSTMSYKPQLLSSMGLFTSRPVRTRTVAIEKKDTGLELVQTSEVGQPPRQTTRDRRNVRDFRVPRLFQQDKLYAHEIQGMRAFGSESELETVQAEVATRMQSLMDNFSYTEEYHLLGAVQGKLLDADGSTIYNWFTEFGVAEPSDIGFTNAAVTAAGDMRVFIQQNVVRPLIRASKTNMPNVEIIALCGDNFFDWFTSHPDVKATYLNWNAAADLRQGNAFTAFSFGGVLWINYRGSDDNSTVAISTNNVRFFPRNIPGMFVNALAPAETFEFVNTAGRPMYARLVPDDKRNEYVDIEVMRYPLPICTRPDVLLKGVRS